jgi:hypothetical protein
MLNEKMSLKILFLYFSCTAKVNTGVTGVIFLRNLLTTDEK